MAEIPFNLLTEYPTHADALRAINLLRAEVDLKGSRLDDALDEIERLRAAGDALVASIRDHAFVDEHAKMWEEARRG